MINLLPSDIQSGIQGVANLLANMAPVYLMCDPRDIHAVAQVKSPFTEQPTIYLYDSYPGGIGLSERIYDMHDELLSAARRSLVECRCGKGCPSCVGPSDELGPRGKELTLQMLDVIVR
jgi:DEAD/DEAH box helicase domain-containing protein